MINPTLRLSLIVYWVCEGDGVKGGKRGENMVLCTASGGLQDMESIEREQTKL